MKRGWMLYRSDGVQISSRGDEGDGGMYKIEIDREKTHMMWLCG